MALKETVASSLISRFEKLAATMRELSTPLSEEQFWTKPFPFGNSFGHLVLHLTGNLNYYIGAQIAQTGYIRDRPLEFSDESRPSKSTVMKNFDTVIDLTAKTIKSRTEEDWSKAYQAVGTDARTHFDLILVCASHLDHHVGQAMYICFALNQ